MVYDWLSIIPNIIWLIRYVWVHQYPIVRCRTYGAATTTGVVGININVSAAASVAVIWNGKEKCRLEVQEVVEHCTEVAALKRRSHVHI